MLKRLLRAYMDWLDPLTLYEARLKAKLLRLDGAHSWLDIGSGDGRFTRLIARQAQHGPGKQICLDLDHSQLAKARRAGLMGLLADTHCMPLAGNSVERVSGYQLLEHVEDPPGFLKDVYRVCREGAIVLLITPNLSVWSAGNPAFAPLLRSRLLRSLSRGFLAPLFAGTHIHEGMEGYETWKREVGHRVDGFTPAECVLLAQEAGFEVLESGTLGSSALYYYYLDAYNFTFSGRWKLLFGPLLPLLAAIEKRFDQQPERRRWLWFKRRPGVNTYAVLQKPPERGGEAGGDAISRASTFGVDCE